jgi:hypothetical protein
VAEVQTPATLTDAPTPNGEEDEGRVEDVEFEAPIPRRALGPAMPPPELLQAAANLPVPSDSDEEEELVGPPPPEYEEEANLGTWVYCLRLTVILNVHHAPRVMYRVSLVSWY